MSIRQPLVNGKSQKHTALTPGAHAGIKATRRCTVRCRHKVYVAHQQACVGMRRSGDNMPTPGVRTLRQAVSASANLPGVQRIRAKRRHGTRHTETRAG